MIRRAARALVHVLTLTGLVTLERAAPAATSYLLGAAETRGLNNAVFSSTLIVSNVGAGTAAVQIGFIPYEGKATPGPVARSLAAGETLRVEHVLAALFGLTADAGTLTVTSDTPLSLSLTTANVADPAGTFGLALQPAAGATLLTAGQTGHAIWATQDAGYRTNVALALIDPGSSVDVVVLDEQAAVLGRATVASAQPVSWQSSLSALTGGRRTSVARVELRVTAGRAAGYTAVVDNVTNDGIAVQAASLAAGSVDYVLDGVVRTAGRNGTYFQTDVRLFNAGAEPLTVVLEALGYRVGPRTVSRLLPPSGVVEIRDLLGPAAFDAGDGLAGAVRFRASGPFLVAGRTSNVDPTGERPGSFSVYQQPVPYPSAFVFPGQRAVVAGVDQTAALPGFRTNLALFAGPSGAAGRLLLRDAAGTQAAAASFTLDGSAWVQRSSSDWFDGAAVPPGSRIELEVTSGSLDAYAARVDNGTGDGVVLTAQAVPGAAGCAAPSISSFTATPGSGTPGAAVTLSLASAGGTAAVVNPGNLTIPLNGSIQVTPGAPTTYTATVVGACAPSAVAAASVAVAPADCAPPEVALFTATPDVVEPGDAVVLRLSAEGTRAIGGAAVISPGGLQLPPNGFVVVHPTETTRYRVHVAGDCSPAGGDSALVTVAPGLSTVLNEVLFDPAGGDPQLVELKVGSAGPPLSQLSLRNEAGRTWALPASLDQPEAGAIVLVVFDGRGTVEGRTIHADLTGFLGSPQGSLALLSGGGETLDAIAWNGHAAALPRAGLHADLPGGTLGRLPWSRQPGGERWTALDPMEATPGHPNRHPGLALVLFAGTEIPAGTPWTLAWYPVPDAISYRFQLAASTSFDPLLLDETTASGNVEVRLPAGTYAARIATRFADGHETPFEGPFLFEAVAPAPGSARQALILPVPLLHQRKDTPMLLLESKREHGRHGWDKAHPATPDGDFPHDPACSMNCGFASSQMINHFLGGTVSQDFLAYSLFSRQGGLPPGPEGDLNTSAGLDNARQTGQVLACAAFSDCGGGAVLPVLVGTDPVRLWTTVKAEINAGRPVMAAYITNRSFTHAVVITGYEQVGPDDSATTLRRLIYNNPYWTQRESCKLSAPQLDVKCPLWDLIWPLGERSPRPMRDPDGLTGGAEPDRILDFDKTSRFCSGGRCLDPAKDDTDEDCIKDKHEVRRSVFDERKGWSHLWPGKHDTSGTARDADGNGTPPELTPTEKKDSDGGGTPDFVEDLNRDGQPDPQETDPYDREDDDVEIEGVYLNLSTVVRSGYADPITYQSVVFSNTRRVELKLEGKPDGTVTGKARIELDRTVTYNYKPDVQCTNVQTWAYDHLSFEADVKADWVCDKDGARLDVTAGSTRPWHLTISNSCNTNRQDRTENAFAVFFSILFQTEEHGRDKRRVAYGLGAGDGISTQSGANTGIFDFRLTPKK